MISANVRRVKKWENGYTTLTERQRQPLIDTLCDRCGKKFDCALYEISLVEKGRTVVVMDCEEYLFPIKFNNLIGTNQSYWNTIRMGGAWSQRVSPGDKVILLDNSNFPSRAATVLKSVTSDADTIVRKHYKHNHMKPESAQEMEKILRRSYGNLVYESSKFATAIYLKSL